MFCAYTSTREPRALSTIACRSVNGTQIAMSHPLTDETRGSSSWMCSSACASVLCIFQLPAISGVRSVPITSPTAACSRSWAGGEPPSRDARAVERLYAGEHAPLYQLQRGAAAGRQMVDGVLQAEMGERGGRIAAADDGNARRARDSLGDRARALRKWLVLEGAHRTVPEDGARLRDLGVVTLDRGGSDVEPH